MSAKRGLRVSVFPDKKGLAAIGGMVRLSDHLFVIAGENRGRFPFSNSFLILGNETVLLDAGIGADRIRTVDSLVRIDTVVISHPHPDHISGLHVLGDRRVLFPAETGDEVFDLELLGARFTGSHEEGRHWAGVLSRTVGLVAPGAPDGRYCDGEVLDFGAALLEAIHAPGHLLDHYCFYDRASGTLFTTDIDFTSFGPWYGNPECSLSRFREDVERMMAREYTRVCPSHKAAIEGDATPAFHAFLDSFERHRETVFQALGRPRTLDELVAESPFYHDRFFDRRIQHVFERNMIAKNLELLVEEGRVGFSGGSYRLLG